MPENLCAVEGCDRVATERGWCHAHYLRWLRLGNVLEDRLIGRQVNTICTVDGCHRPAAAKGLCGAHKFRKRAHGDVKAETPVKEIAGIGHVNHGYFVVPVAPELRHLVAGETSALQHRLVMAQLLGRPLQPDESVHHKNGDRLDNRPQNLELWSRWQPSGQRVSDKIRHALDVIERYVPELLAGRPHKLE